MTHKWVDDYDGTPRSTQTITLCDQKPARFSPRNGRYVDEYVSCTKCLAIIDRAGLPKGYGTLLSQYKDAVRQPKDIGEVEHLRI